VAGVRSNLGNLRRRLAAAPARKKQPGDKLINRWLWIAAGVALLALLIDQPLLIGLAILLALVTGSAWLWQRFGLSALHYERTLSVTHANFGEAVELEITVENRKPLPLVWLDVQDQFPDALPVVGVKLESALMPRRAIFRTVFDIRPYERVRRHYTIVAAARGWYQFGPVLLQTGDPLGLVKTSDEVRGVVELVVHPEIKSLASFGLPAELPLGERKPHRPLIEDPFTVDGIRPYAAGDTPRQLNWRASARTGELQSKRYEKRTTPSLQIMLDANTFERFWEGQDTALLERAISLAASVASHALDRGYQVGLSANAPPAGSGTNLRVGSSANRRQLGRILDGLARLVGGTGSRIERVIAEETRSLPWGASVVVVSPNVTEGLQLALLALSRRGVRPVLLSCGNAAPTLADGLKGRVQAYHVAGDVSGEEGSRAFEPVAIAG
jgi:uncharacterized protein (DUF58 family)